MGSHQLEQHGTYELCRLGRLVDLGVLFELLPLHRRAPGISPTIAPVQLDWLSDRNIEQLANGPPLPTKVFEDESDSDDLENARDGEYGNDIGRDYGRDRAEDSRSLGTTTP